jgi:hypothetical protein
MAFIADVKLVANMWLRGGNTSSATNFLGFLEDTLSKLKNKTVSLIRLDSGFSNPIFLSRKRLPKRTFRFLAAGQEITQRRKNSFPETSPEEDL